MDQDKEAPQPPRQLPPNTMGLPTAEEMRAQIKKEFPNITEEEMDWYGL
jgi:hypothetical protein